MPRLDELFRDMVARKASDLHLAVGVQPKMRIHGHLEPVRERELDAAEAGELLSELVAPEQWSRFLEHHDLDFAHQVPGVVRLRANYFVHQGGLGAVFRVIPTEILSCEDLNLPETVVSLAELRSGMVLVTGPTGSGKSTTLAAMLDHINAQHARHIITIEEPVEFVHRDRKSVVVQREVGVHAASFSGALRAAVREDPDVIMVGEMRDRETVSLALRAAEMGFLIFGTLHTNSAAKTIDRIIDIFPASEQGAARISLASSLRGVVSQQLLRRVSGKGRVAAFEILVGTLAVTNAVREGDTAKLYSIIQSGRGLGMETMDDALRTLVSCGAVTLEEARRKAIDKSKFDLPDE
ncbi:MAG: type IV pilus twitching motility protein PilT [Deltaproteobacteria bacterium]|nr:type IV pilus twitching motility protein PilT [Deltaproteobacteria bacterium]